jgi:hypothetical protein
VRRGPKGSDEGGATQLTVGGGAMAQRCEDGAAAAVGSANVDTRPRKERRGATKCSSTRSRGRTRGERKGGCGVGDGPRATPRDSETWGRGGGEGLA